VESYPPWTALDFHRCPNCPLPRTEARCPVAASLVGVVETFRHHRSWERVHVTVTARDRQYAHEVDLQRGISSLLGIYMVTAGCPVLNRLRPMVDTHLPFMSPEETTYRMMSMYLVAQYFLQEAGLRPDWRLRKFVRALQETGTVNRAFTERLREAGIEDASLNAVATLNSLGEITAISLETDEMARLRRIFLSQWRPGS